MIKINLLPKNINQKAIIRNTAIAFGALFVAVIAGGIAFSMSVGKERDEWKAKAEAATQIKSRVTALQSETQAALDSIKPMKSKMDSITAVADYNLRFPALYREVAKWTYKGVQYVSMSTTGDGKSVQMEARVKNLDELGRYLLNVYRATDLFTKVNVSWNRNGGPGMGQGMGPGMGPGYAPSMSSGSGSMAGLGAISAGVERTPQLAVQNDITLYIDGTLQPKWAIVPPTVEGAPAPNAAGGTPGTPAPPTPPAAG